MRSAIGNSLLMSIVVIIVSLIILVFVNILSYTKAYRVKNGIIEILEKNESVLRDNSIKNEQEDENVESSEEFPASINTEIGEYLKQVGYTIGNCPKNTNVKSETGYKYCIEKTYTSGTSFYYTITTYVEYNFPIINSLLKVPVTGQTRTLSINYDDYD